MKGETRKEHVEEVGWDGSGRGWKVTYQVAIDRQC